MKTLPILTAPDVRLLKTAKFVEYDKITSDDIKEKAEQMLATLKKSGGVGLSSIQVGIEENIIICKLDGEYVTMINPTFITRSEKMYSSYEQCLSLGKFGANVQRHWMCIISYYGLDGILHDFVELSGLNATIVQHEMDHQKGVLFVDHLTDKQKKKNSKQLKRMGK